MSGAQSSLFCGDTTLELAESERACADQGTCDLKATTVPCATSEKVNHHGLEGEEAHVSHVRDAPATREFCCRMLLQNVFAGGIIGRGGREINCLRSQSHTGIDIKKGHRGDCWRLVIIKGVVQDVILGATLIAEKVALLNPQTGHPIESSQAHAPQLAVHVLVPQRLAGLIIGRAGSTIKALNSQTGSYIKFVDQFLGFSDERPLEVRGSRECLAVALDKIFAFWARYPRIAATVYPFDPDRACAVPTPEAHSQPRAWHTAYSSAAYFPHQLALPQFASAGFGQVSVKPVHIPGPGPPRHHSRLRERQGLGSPWLSHRQFMDSAPLLGPIWSTKRVAGPTPPSAHDDAPQQTAALLHALSDLQQGAHFFTLQGEPEPKVEVTIPVPHHLIGGILHRPTSPLARRDTAFVGVIGRRGANVAGIRADSQAYVKIRDEVPHMTYREVHIIGSGEKVARAVGLLRGTILSETSSAIQRPTRADSPRDDQ